MNRRSFLGWLSAAPVLVGCAKALGDEPWPGPASPVSYVTNPPPRVGERLRLSDAEWRRRLTREQFDVLRTHGTERAFSCPLTREHRRGTFHCAGCGAPLFRSNDKFESGTGWPSFTQPIEGRIGTSTDSSFGMTRTEVHCARCEGHLGHAFDDGPPPTGRRFCINGVAVEFRVDAAP
jgi:peptide-methionine (R)-S-oxide reductase